MNKLPKKVFKLVKLPISEGNVPPRLLFPTSKTFIYDNWEISLDIDPVSLLPRIKKNSRFFRLYIKEIFPDILFVLALNADRLLLWMLSGNIYPENWLSWIDRFFKLWRPNKEDGTLPYILLFLKSTFDTFMNAAIEDWSSIPCNPLPASSIPFIVVFSLSHVNPRCYV